jgi:hypothetical protein
MMGAAMRVETGKGVVVVKNDPRVPGEYEDYRRKSLHLSVLHRNHRLFIEPVMVEQVWERIMEKGPSLADVLQAMDKGYRWRKTGADRYTLNGSRVLGKNLWRQSRIDSALTSQNIRRLDIEATGGRSPQLLCPRVGLAH